MPVGLAYWYSVQWRDEPDGYRWADSWLPRKRLLEDGFEKACAVVDMWKASKTTKEDVWHNIAQDYYGQEDYGQDGHRQNDYGQDDYGQEDCGHNVYCHNDYGQDDYGQDEAATLSTDFHEQSKTCSIQQSSD
ncbi:hypothetical protein PHYSODRAFT_331421 [Phytophthora sojae]|uniref:Uncharacterized protein n=1 Tax=Phytophthora sojae (strain P6497) TaxID=1094619 RepID=G4ZEV1_PHYSP|nr:hypothetical protein PHYSODRAFT_331421 [Phytophthora sojae]EGZ17447.1 hypothetical protein PHYSODRAFT_331421 [Phytophthora sojae]|eukprot:XP_009526505.1 hypothetical protein PHYSODRAFT_331421 [Phytophthora sojae]